MITANGQITSIVKASAGGTTNIASAATQKPFNRMRITHSGAAQTVFSLRTSTTTTAPTADNVPASDGTNVDSLGGFTSTTTGGELLYGWAEVQASWGIKPLNAGAFTMVIETWLSS